MMKKNCWTKYYNFVCSVVTVGGDGIVCECLSGLVMRAQRDAGVDFNDPDAETVSSKIPIGIIPAGEL